MGASSSSGDDSQGSQSQRVHYDNTGSLSNPEIYDEIVFGDSEDITFGLYNEICVGSYLDLTIGMLLEVVVGPMVEFCGGGLFEMTGLPFGILRTWAEEFDSDTASTVPLAAQYDLVTGSYYEILSGGSMYYWNPALEDLPDEGDPGTFTVKNEMYVASPAAETHLPQTFYEVVGQKTILASVSIQCVVPVTSCNITIAGEGVVFEATQAMNLVAATGPLQAQGETEATLSTTEFLYLSGASAAVSLSDDTFAVSSAGSITMPVSLIEMGQPPVTDYIPPTAAEAAAAAAAEAAAEAAEEARAATAAARLGKWLSS
jgi:hypothetical protein